jgi:hypothetical protein
MESKIVPPTRVVGLSVLTILLFLVNSIPKLSKVIS